MSARTSPHRAGGLLALVGTILIAAPSLFAGGASYSSTFDVFPAEGWSEPRWETAPSGQRLMGPFANEPTTLTLTNLPDHTHIVIAVDVVIIGGWTGNGGVAPNEFRVMLDGSDEVFVATFSNDQEGDGRPQSYPDGVVGAAHPPRHGAFDTNTLDYLDRRGGQEPDSVYRLFLSVKHSGPTAKLTFSASGLAAESEARWALDNVGVFTYSMGDTPSADLFSRPSQTMLEGFSADADPSSLGTNPPSGRGGIPGGGGGGGGGDPPDGPRPSDTPQVIPSPGTGALLLLGGLLATRRRRTPT